MSLKDQITSIISHDDRPSFWGSRRQEIEDLSDDISSLKERMNKTYKKLEDTLEKRDVEIERLRVEIRGHYEFMQGVILAVLESKQDAPKVTGAVAAYLARKGSANGTVKPKLPG